MSYLSPGLLTTSYYFDARHSILSDIKATVYGSNVGNDGRNLTIAFLSLNRSILSIKLLRSIVDNIPNFAGEVLIGDNGSTGAELALLRKHLADFPYKWRILEFGKNYGVAGGRNRMMSEASTDWVISLDNDIYLTRNPVRHIQQEIAALGCHFMSFPLLNPDGKTLFANGACLQSIIQGGRPRLTINPLVVPGSPADATQHGHGPATAFLSTFLFGGASILNRTSFQRLGGFDENMLIGFEDIDFSLRLFREGMKIGTSSLQFLIHDHQKAASEADTDYERMRFSRQTLYESARYLEAKTGFVVWGEEIENWMLANEKKQGWSDTSITAIGTLISPAKITKRPRVALLTDTDNWAFANISRQLKKHLSDRFEFEIIPLVNLGEIEHSRWLSDGCTGYFAEGGASALGTALVAVEDFDIVHIFWREFLTIVDTPLLEAYAKRFGMTNAQFRHRFLDNKIISTCVYDHLFLEAADMAARTRIFRELASGYYVSSNKLREIYDCIEGIPAPSAVLSDGVDLGLFKPRHLERLRCLDSRPIRVGWVGHSGWAATLEDFKGVNSILKPALAELVAEGLPLELRFADRKERLIPHDQMPDYYAEIDILICTSKIEGTPNPVLEAMACGVPVISTDVGIVSEAFGPKQQAYILPDRSIQSLKQALRRLVSDHSQFVELSAENLLQIKQWDWDIRVEPFANYFDGLLHQQELATGEARTKMCMLPFTTPSMEPDGSIRLCSASSIFAYYDETNMGNAQRDGLSHVWTGERYREVRKSLLSGESLRPYCASCEYRFDGPAWLFQLHLGLHAYHSGCHSPDVLALIGRRANRYDEYRSKASGIGLNPLALPEEVKEKALVAFSQQSVESKLPLVDRLAPEPIVDASSMPVYMDFNTLNRCNVSCTMCPPAIRFDVQGKKRDPYYRLTLTEYKKITEGVRIESAHFVGAYAEPLLNKEIFDLVAYAKSQGAFTAITTNAMALNRGFAVRLLDAGLDMMTISLHGATKEVAQKIMRNSNFDRIVGNIRGLQELKKSRGINYPELYFNFVGQLDNVHEIPAFIDLAADLGVRFINLIHLIDGDAAVDKQASLTKHLDLLVPNVIAAKARAQANGIHLLVSPAYEAAVFTSTKSLESV